MTPKQRRLFDAHTHIAERVARNVWHRTPGLNGMDMDDYRQLGMMGLMQAAKRFRVSFGKPFERYASIRIAGYIRDGIRQADEVKRTQRAAGIKGPTVRLGEADFGSDGDRAMLISDRLASADDGGEARRDAFDEIRQVLGGLPAEARAAVYLSRAYGLTYYEISCVLGLDEDRVRDTVTDAWELLEQWHIAPTQKDRRLMEQPSLFSSKGLDHD